MPLNVISYVGDLKPFFIKKNCTYCPMIGLSIARKQFLALPLVSSKSSLARSLITFIEGLVSKTLIFIIIAIRPLLGSFGCCRYAFSCYDYGIKQLQEQRLLKAIWCITLRVLSCNPLLAFFRNHSNF